MLKETAVTTQVNLGMMAFNSDAYVEVRDDATVLAPNDTEVPPHWFPPTRRASMLRQWLAAINLWRKNNK